MYTLLLTLCIAWSLPLLPTCPPAIPAQNLWQLANTIYCLLTDCKGTAIEQEMIPYVISQPGYYYLCESVDATGAATPAITIASSDVHLDLNGFTVSTDDGQGIACISDLVDFSNITIENGIINATEGGLNIRGNPPTSQIINLAVRNLTITSSTLVYANVFYAIKGGRLENVSVNNNNTLGAGYLLFQLDSDSVFEIVNCTARGCNYGFWNEHNNNVTFKNCTSTSNQGFGFLSTGDFVLLENCVAMENGQEGFMMFSGTDVTYKNCVSAGNLGSGFHFRISTAVVFEGCISNDNDAHGFHNDSTSGTNENCVFENCLSTDNSLNGFYFDGPSTQSRIFRCIASGNGASGIVDHVASVATFIVDTRSQHAATAINPAYNLNTNPDVLGADTVVIIS